MKKKSSLDGAYRHNPDTAWRRIEDESVVLDLKSSAYYSLNDTASVVWEALGEGLTPRQAAERLCEEFEEKPESVLRDVESVVDELIKERLIQRSDA